MRCNPWRWLWGLIPVVMLSWVTYRWERPNIEADLMSRSREMLERTGSGWASATFTGRDAVLSGRAAEADGAKAALDAVRSVWGVRLVEPRTDLTGRVDAYVWSASIRDNKIRLKGFVPNEDARKAIVGVVKVNFPQAEIVDAMSLAQGAPGQDLWLGGIGFGLKQLAGLRRGLVALEGTALSIAGEAADTASYRSIQAALEGGVPDGLALADSKVTPPVVTPFTWSARFAEKQLVLSGYAPTEEVREQIFAHAKQVFPKAAIVDRTEVAEGAPEEWAKAALLSLDQLDRLIAGKAIVRGTDLTLSGTAEDEATASAVRRTLQAEAPRGFDVSDAVRITDLKLPVAKPFVTAVEAGRDTIELSGYAPSKTARMALVSHLRTRLPDKAITDRLELAGGAPDGWQSCIEAGVAGLGRLDSGRAQLSDRRLDLTGETVDEGLAMALSDEVQAALEEACDAVVRVDLKPTARREAAPAKMEQEAHAGAEARRADVAAKQAEYVESVRKAEAQAGARREAELAKVRHEADAGAEARRADVAARQAEYAETVRKAEAQAGARRQADLAEAKRKAETLVAARREAEEVDTHRPAGAQAEKLKAEARACQKRLSEAAAKGAIEFERASAEIDAHSSATLDKLARVAGACPSVRIEISGHTDAEGEPARNQNLSERRARAVAGYLAKAGVAAARLIATGYGATRPVAPNDTPKNRAKNRRIEFAILPN